MRKKAALDVMMESESLCKQPEIGRKGDTKIKDSFADVDKRTADKALTNQDLKHVSSHVRIQ